MFIGRETELNALEKAYKRGKFQMVVMYGRRRVGKTTLVSKFILFTKASINKHPDDIMVLTAEELFR